MSDYQGRAEGKEFLGNIFYCVRSGMRALGELRCEFDGEVER